jgi:hypothetical protein
MMTSRRVGPFGPPVDTCAFCGQEIYWQGHRWRHLSTLLAACENGITSAQPEDVYARWKEDGAS